MTSPCLCPVCRINKLYELYDRTAIDPPGPWVNGRYIVVDWNMAKNVLFPQNSSRQQSK
jgi:hypothetical protein